MCTNYYWRKPLSVAELLEEAENLDMYDSLTLPDGIYITPPENSGENTDFDSGDEEDTNPNRLSRGQLREEGEFMYCRENRGILLSSQDEIEDGEISGGVDNREFDSYQQSHEEPQSPKKRFKTEMKFEWRKGDLNKFTPSWNGTMVPPLSLSKHSHPIEFFDLFMSTSLVSHLARSYGYEGDNLHFKREISQYLLKKYGSIPKIPGPRRATIVCTSSEGPHLIICQQARRRCSLCENKTTKACNSCNIPLHDKCFDEFRRIK